MSLPDYPAASDYRERLAIAEKRIAELTDTLLQCRRMLHAMDTSPAHAVSWIRPRTNATRDMVAHIDLITSPKATQQ